MCLWVTVFEEKIINITAVSDRGHGYTLINATNDC